MADVQMSPIDTVLIAWDINLHILIKIIPVQLCVHCALHRIWCIFLDSMVLYPAKWKFMSYLYCYAHCFSSLLKFSVQVIFFFNFRKKHSSAKPCLNPPSFVLYFFVFFVRYNILFFYIKVYRKSLAEMINNIVEFNEPWKDFTIIKVFLIE